MARIDSFLKKWASVPSQFERPADALIDRGWAGGAAEDPPEAKWENWWHNRVDEALAELESKGALQWFGDVPYGVGGTVHNGGKNWIAAIANTGIEPAGVDNVGHWIELGAGATEAVSGPARVATQAQTDSGTDDATIVTPKKLRWGFSVSLAQNGYIAFPAWLKGVIIQWGAVSVGAVATVNVPLPIAFPVQGFFATTIRKAGAPVNTADSCGSVDFSGLAALAVARPNGSTDTVSMFWLAIGN